MAEVKNDNFDIRSPKTIDKRSMKFVSGVSVPYVSAAEAHSLITYKAPGVPIYVLENGVQVEYQYVGGVLLSNLIRVFNPSDMQDKYATLADLVETDKLYNTGQTISTTKFSSSTDEGKSTYLVIDDLGDYEVDDISIIELPGGKFGKIIHDGLLNISQFGAVGDGVTNDYDAFKKANDYARLDRTVKTILLSQGLTYRLVKQNVDSNDCFLRIDYSDITWDGNGSTVLYDNDATQSYVYYTTGGTTGIYRAKNSHISSSTPPSKVLYWGLYEWQIIEDDVTPTGLYPFWGEGIQYHGVMQFVQLGFPFTDYPTLPEGKAENVVFKNMKITAGEPQERTSNEGYWNTYAKPFIAYENISGFTIDNVEAYGIISEFITGAGFVSVDNIVFKNSKFHDLIEAISMPGNITVENCDFYEIPTHGVESSSFSFQQVYRNNHFYNCQNGLTVGAYGPGGSEDGSVNIKSYVTIEGNRIHGCDLGINLARRDRGTIVKGNTIYDCRILVNIFGENSEYPDASSDMIICNNSFESYEVDVAVGIAFGNVNSTANTQTANILVTGNVFQISKTAKVKGFNTHINAPIQFYGNNFENISIIGNTNFFDETLFPLVSFVSSTFKPYVAFNNTSINLLRLTEYYENKWTVKSDLNLLKITNEALGTNALTINNTTNQLTLPGGLTNGTGGLTLSSYTSGRSLIVDNQKGLSTSDNFIAFSDYGSERMLLGTNAAQFQIYNPYSGPVFTIDPADNAIKFPTLAGSGTRNLTVTSTGVLGAATAIDPSNFASLSGANTFTNVGVPITIITTDVSAKPIVFDHQGGDGTADNFIRFKDYGAERMAMGTYQAKFHLYNPSYGSVFNINPADNAILFPTLAGTGTEPMTLSSTGQIGRGTNLSLTTTGTGGTPTLISNVLNIPAYAALGSSFPAQQAHTSGATVTITDQVTDQIWLIVNPAATLPALAITLPAVPVNGQTVAISFGGTVTSGAVVTTLSTVPSGSDIIIEETPPTTGTAGTTIYYRYRTSNTTWYRG